MNCLKPIFLTMCFALWYLQNLSCAHANSQAPLQAGKGDYEFQGNISRLKVYYYKPAKTTPETPVWFILHGTTRNADDYRDNWVELADQYGAMIVAPQFDKDNYSGYNLGGVLNSRGKSQSKEKMMFHNIELLFDDMVKREGLVTDRYSLFGHSAGAQFVQRMVMFYPDCRIGVAVIANPGWYSLPISSKEFPYGLGKTGLTESDLQKPFQIPMFILLGEGDTDSNHKYLNDSPGANEQGPHRLARGQNFHRVCMERSGELKLPCNWTMRIIPGVAHSNQDMAKYGAEMLSGGKAPLKKPVSPAQSATRSND